MFQIVFSYWITCLIYQSANAHTHTQGQGRYGAKRIWLQRPEVWPKRWPSMSLFYVDELCLILRPSVTSRQLDTDDILQQKQRPFSNFLLTKQLKIIFFSKWNVGYLCWSLSSLSFSLPCSFFPRPLPRGRRTLRFRQKERKKEKNVYILHRLLEHKSSFSSCGFLFWKTKRKK